jgi:hypothetical protein
LLRERELRGEHKALVDVLPYGYGGFGRFGKYIVSSYPKEIRLAAIRARRLELHAPPPEPEPPSTREDDIQAEIEARDAESDYWSALDARGDDELEDIAEEFGT